MVRVVKKKTTLRRWLKFIEEPEIRGRPYITFDVLQDVSKECDVDTARNLGMLCREMNHRLSSKISQPLIPYDRGVTYCPELKIDKELPDKITLKANGKTVIVPVSRYMRYIWYIHCSSLVISMEEGDISTYWKQIYKHFKDVCREMKIHCPDMFPGRDPPMSVFLIAFKDIQKIIRIVIEGDQIDFICSDNPDNRNEERTISIQFLNLVECSADFIISVIQKAPLSEICSVLIYTGFETVRPAIAAFGLTQSPVQQDVFENLYDNDITFELSCSGAKLRISDTPDFVGYYPYFDDYDSDDSVSVDYGYDNVYDYSDDDDDFYNFLEELI